MWHFLGTFFDIILPRKERVTRIDSYSLSDLHLSLAEHTVHGKKITTLMSYRTQAVDDLVRALKYNSAAHASKLLAEALAEYLQEEVAQQKLFSARPVILVPVPLHKNRLTERGFNQIEVILSTLPEEFRDGTSSKLASDALVRTRDTEQQTRLSRSKRLSNVADAFSLVRPELVENASVILIDDVTTTGATLTEAAKPFIHSNVTLLALAHA